MLNDPNPNSTQISKCDCWRANPFNWERSFENRFTRRKTIYGEINLIHFQNYQNNIRISVDFPPFASFDDKPKCEPGWCSNRVNAFDGDLNKTLWEILPALGTTHAFINLGWEVPYPFPRQSEFTCTMERFMKAHPETKLYLISHPPVRGNVAAPERAFDPKHLKCKDNVGVLDRSSPNKGTPRSWYWDRQHLLRYVVCAMKRPIHHTHSGLTHLFGFFIVS